MSGIGGLGNEKVNLARVQRYKVSVFGHAYGGKVMLGDARTVRLKSRTAIEGARLTDQYIKTQPPLRQLLLAFTGQ